MSGSTESFLKLSDFKLECWQETIISPKNRRTKIAPIIMLNFNFQFFPIIAEKSPAQQKIPKSPHSSSMEFKGNGQFSLGNLRETEIYISPLESYRKCVCFPRIYQTKNVVKFHNFLQCREQRQRQILVSISILKSWVKIKGFDPFKVSLLIGSLDMRLMNVRSMLEIFGPQCKN